MSASPVRTAKKLPQRGYHPPWKTCEGKESRTREKGDNALIERINSATGGILEESVPIPKGEPKGNLSSGRGERRKGKEAMPSICLQRNSIDLSAPSAPCKKKAEIRIWQQGDKGDKKPIVLKPSNIRSTELCQR